MTTIEHMPKMNARRAARAARKARAQATVAKVYVANCNRRPTTTPACLADNLRSRLDSTLSNIISVASATIIDFQKKLAGDAFNAFDWSGKSAVEAAGKKRAAQEVQAVLTAIDDKNDGYQGGCNVDAQRRTHRWLLTEIMNKCRWSGQQEPKDLARTAGLAEIFDEVQYTLDAFKFEFVRVAVPVAQDYDGWLLDDDTANRYGMRGFFYK